MIRPRCTSGEFQSAPAITGGRSAHGPQGVPGPVQFQSAPAITGGRSNGHHARLIARRCFNPRPPSLAGDPDLDPPALHVRRVSIRARHHWRAIRARPARRSWPGSVSIRARHHWRAIQWSSRSAHCPTLFQSAPAITGGRSAQPDRASHTRLCFNPRPPSLAGDPTSDMLKGEPLPVSIRARHHWRAIPRRRRLVGHQGGVSIRARHHWRAIRAPRPPQLRSADVSIRARHHWRAIQHSMAPRQARDMFQSAPAITGGRSPHWLCADLTSSSFNPRPPSLAGDPGGLEIGAVVVGVSIRARHHWRAIRPASTQWTLSGMFQSAPAITGGRSRARAAGAKGCGCFNPRPPSLAGDPGDDPRHSPAIGVSIRARHHWRAIRAALAMTHGIRTVSIRARHHWRAIPRRARRNCARRMFQSAPAITGGRSPHHRRFLNERTSFNPRPPSLAGDPYTVPL